MPVRNAPARLRIVATRSARPPCRRSRRTVKTKGKKNGGGKLFRRLRGDGECRIADPVPVRRLLTERSGLMKNSDAEQSDGRIQRHAEPKTQRDRISHCSPA